MGCDAEEDQEQRQAVDEVEEDVEGDDALRAGVSGALEVEGKGQRGTHIDGPYADGLCRLGMLFNQLGEP